LLPSSCASEQRGVLTWSLPLLLIIVAAQDCSRPVPGPNMDLKDSDIVLTTFPDGHRATFVCSLGYTTAGGVGVVTCTAGSWSQVTLQCKKKICGSPGQVDNGEIKYLSENEFGDKIVVTFLGWWGNVNSPVEIKAGWAGYLNVKVLVTCDPPAGIPNGLFSPVKDVYNYREVVQYSCTGDFTLSGSKSVTCSEDGTFTPGLPQCTEVECADPKVANGEWVSGSRPPHKYLATVTYRCNAGYKMEGDASMECGLNGQWTFKTKCEALFPSHGSSCQSLTLSSLFPEEVKSLGDFLLGFCTILDFYCSCRTEGLCFYIFFLFSSCSSNLQSPTNDYKRHFQPTETFVSVPRDGSVQL
uniref:Sushi domain-containing protein n=1 Tax=Takifugu rubripes TaxID=31033 RepID=A0A674MPT3_TAKRU